eukprot:PLAT12996.1.p1 GENE.PLAT12996.1~~PLAT12996.1.p1  ORF type:complete len:439 (-),score=125.67 PLAT12996.1:53-1369(-)
MPLTAVCLPVPAGLGLVGATKLRQSVDEAGTRSATQAALALLPVDASIHLTEEESHCLTPRGLDALRVYPFRAVSRLFGQFADLKLPEMLRPVLYRAWAFAFHAKVGEAELPLREYETLGEFFTRRLQPGCRPLDDTSDSAVLSPVDGTIRAVGRLDHHGWSAAALPTGDDSKPAVSPPLGGWVEQVKGIRYHLRDMLRQEVRAKPGNAIHHIVIYLAPGDYHRFHSPVDWQARTATHVAGELLPVGSWTLRGVRALFALNERVALCGDWQHGFYSLTAVGAANVGNITIDGLPDLQCNAVEQDSALGKSFTHALIRQLPAGSEVGMFKLGSTIVLAFEAPTDFRFSVAAGDTVRLGERLGAIVKKEDETSEEESSDFDPLHPRVDVAALFAEQAARERSKLIESELLKAGLSADSPRFDVWRSRLQLGDAYAPRRRS